MSAWVLESPGILGGQLWPGGGPKHWATGEPSEGRWVGPCPSSGHSTRPLSARRGVGADAFGASRGEDEPGAAGSSGRGAFLRWFSVLLPLRHGPMVSRRGNSRSLALLPAIPFAHILWRLERRGEASARARPLDPSFFFQLLSAKCCQDVHVRSRETPASWEAFVAASSMARGFPHCPRSRCKTGRIGTRSLSNPNSQWPAKNR